MRDKNYTSMGFVFFFGGRGTGEGMVLATQLAESEFLNEGSSSGHHDESAES